MNYQYNREIDRKIEKLGMEIDKLFEFVDEIDEYERSIMSKFLVRANSELENLIYMNYSDTVNEEVICVLGFIEKAVQIAKFIMNRIKYPINEDFNYNNSIYMKVEKNFLNILSNIYRSSRKPELLIEKALRMQIKYITSLSNSDRIDYILAYERCQLDEEIEKRFYKDSEDFLPNNLKSDDAREFVDMALNDFRYYIGNSFESEYYDQILDFYSPFLKEKNKFSLILGVAK